MRTGIALSISFIAVVSIAFLAPLFISYPEDSYMAMAHKLQHDFPLPQEAYVEINKAHCQHAYLSFTMEQICKYYNMSYEDLAEVVRGMWK